MRDAGCYAEKVETIPLSVIKKDQTREPYDRAKIQGGILRACYKRPIPVEKIEMTIDSIEGDIFDSADREIPSTRIGEIVMEHLKDLDAVAYVRFASNASTSRIAALYSGRLRLSLCIPSTSISMPFSRQSSVK